MAKIGRNSPCPCGSGRKFKKCHGTPLAQQEAEVAASVAPFDPEIQIKRHAAAELIRTQQQGLGKPVVSARSHDHQMVAVGDTLYFSKSWRVFADFLSDYIKRILGSEWGNEQLKLSLNRRHPILQWYDGYCRFQQKNAQEKDGIHSANATGVVSCYLGLAYNLYLLKHNVELQERLVQRLKNVGNFQGAYYELIVANCLIRAGFELDLEDETDDSKKHCEFSAVSKLTGKKYWVEAKMRSEEGLLGKTVLDGSKASDVTSKISDHLRDALKKPADDERMIFIDVNGPPLDNDEEPAWGAQAIRRLESREKDLPEGMQAYVFVTSMSFHRCLEDENVRHAALAVGLGISDFGKSGNFRLVELYRRKQKHIDAHNIMESLQTYPKIPTTFDGTLISESLKGGREKIEIGQTYFFEGVEKDGLTAEVTTAMVSETEKKLYVGLSTGNILTQEMSDEELRDYKAHSDAYFGVVEKASRNIDDPFELYEWLVDNHESTSRDRLLELMKEAPDLEELAKLPREELVLHVCERWATFILAESPKA